MSMSLSASSSNRIFLASPTVTFLFFGFFGITDVRIVRAEGLATGEPAKAVALDAARAQIRQLAANEEALAAWRAPKPL